LKNIIYYFSATGNCLTAARDTAKILDDTELVNIADMLNEKRIDLPCGTCARVCPKHNIVLKDSSPKFGGNCERCTACIQWCPAKAIDYKDVTQTRKQYRHPNVKASDIFTK
jgi:MinD superfamily P-loop ATPase